jgi:seryl-tRNA synthetase
MLDIKLIRENPQKVSDGCQKKGIEVNIARLLEVDKKRKDVLQALEDMRSKKNQANRDIQGGKGDKEKIIMQMRELDTNNDRLDGDLKVLEEEFNKLMRQIPNLPLDEVPFGKDDRENVVMREEGQKPKFNFKPRDYLDIAEKLDIIDVKRAALVSGSRFGYLKGEAAILEFALVNLVLDVVAKENFVPVIPPVMLKPEMMEGMGYTDRGRDEIYFLEKDGLYLIGTSEQSLGAMHANETFQAQDLPKRYAGFSTCFRREAGAYGKDTKGILRVHQFDKIEMFSFCSPEKSAEEHLLLLSLEEKIMQLLGVPYRVLRICTGDLGDPAAAKYDIEAWMPGQNQYRETHSTSNCTDYQARRLNIRYKDAKTQKTEFVHTLNGTGLAIGRALIAIIENYQQKDGSIKVPKVLQKYTKFKLIKNK